jgi:hypothetical protein
LCISAMNLHSLARIDGKHKSEVHSGEARQEISHLLYSVACI